MCAQSFCDTCSVCSSCYIDYWDESLLSGCRGVELPVTSLKVSKHAQSLKVVHSLRCQGQRKWRRIMHFTR